MAKKKLDESGLPLADAEGPRGSLTIRLDDEGWTKLAELRAHWSTQRKVNLSLTDAVRAAVYKAHQTTLGESEQTAQPTPEPAQKPTRRK
jgi:hypothetical protein